MRNVRAMLGLSTVVLCLFGGRSEAWTADEVDFPNTDNGFSLTTPTFKYTGPDGFSEWFRMYLVPTNNVSPFQFKMVTGNDWNQDYGGNLAFAKNTWDQMFYQPLGDSNSELVGGLTANRRYIFTVKDPGLADTFISIQEISADPIKIERISGGTGFGYSTGSTVQIQIVMTNAPSPEEKAYVRYTADNFASYSIATTSLEVVTNQFFTQGQTNETVEWVSTATIGPPLIGNTTYQWYAFTTTADQNELQTAGGPGVDALTLEWDNNGGANYSFSTFGPFTPGAVTNWFTDTSGGTNRLVFQFGTGLGECEVVAYASDTVRVRWHWTGLYDKDDIGIDRTVQEFPPFGVSFDSGPNRVSMTLPEVVVDVTTNAPFQITVKNTNGDILMQTERFEFDEFYDPVIDSTYDNLRYNQLLPVNFKVKAIIKSPPTEAIFGLGSEAQSLNRRQRDIQLWNSDTFSWEEDWNPMYNTFPFIYVVESNAPNRAYGLFFNNPARPVFRLGTQTIDGDVNEHYSFEAGDGQVDFFVFGGGDDHDMPTILTRYSELTGLPAFLPKWNLGYQQCRWSYWNQDWIHYLADTFIASNFPVDVLYLDLDYFNQGDPLAFTYSGANQLHQLIWNSGNFTNPVHMIDYCLDRGIRLIPIVEPWINNTDPKWGDAASQFHFVELLVDATNSSQAVTPIFFGNVSWIDFTSSTASQWWKTNLLGWLETYPFEGIWNDLNEPADAETLPRNALYFMDGRFGDNFDSRRWHVNVKNTYCIFECRVTFDTLQTRFPDRRPVVISRAGYPGIQKYALSWSGDNTADWDANRYNIRLGNSVMISGQVNFGHDLGGFVTETTPELLTRWTQWGAMNPLFRNHSMKSAAEREPWRFDHDHFSWMREWAWFRYRLMPYLYTMSWSSSQDGIPMNAPPVFFFQEDPTTFSENENEIMVGEYLMAAPMYQQGAVDRWVYLPGPGEVWYDWMTGEKFDGGTVVNVPAPMSVLPLFARQGAIIPMGPKMQNVYEFQPDFLELRCWPSTNRTEFLLYEDDGLTKAYTNGVFAKTRFGSERMSDRWVFDIGATDGTYDAYTNGTRDFIVMGHDLPMIDEVLVNGTPLSRMGDKTVLRTSTTNAWVYDTAENKLYVKIPETGATNRIEAVYRSGWSPTVPTSFASSYSTMAVSANFNLWNTAARNMKLVDDHVWAGTISLSNAANVRFKFAANDTWDDRWGDGGQVNAVVPINETGSFGGDSASDIQIAGTLTGLFSFRFNETSLQYSVTFAADTDSDGDGMDDGWEVAHGLDPLEAQDAGHDLNNDGMTNLENYQLEANPLLVGSDEDDFTDLEEAIAGTDPVDGQSRFEWSGTLGDLTGPRIEWAGVTGRLYEVLYKPTADDAPWQTLPGASNIPGVLGAMSIVDTNAADDVRVYRIGVER